MRARDAAAAAPPAVQQVRLSPLVLSGVERRGMTAKRLSMHEAVTESSSVQATSGERSSPAVQAMEKVARKTWCRRMRQRPGSCKHAAAFVGTGTSRRTWGCAAPQESSAPDDNGAAPPPWCRSWPAGSISARRAPSASQGCSARRLQISRRPRATLSGATQARLVRDARAPLGSSSRVVGASSMASLQPRRPSEEAAGERGDLLCRTRKQRKHAGGRGSRSPVELGLEHRWANQAHCTRSPSVERFLRRETGWLTRLAPAWGSRATATRRPGPLRDPCSV